jgi:nicotinamide riboside kinase
MQEDEEDDFKVNNDINTPASQEYIRNRLQEHQRMQERLEGSPLMEESLNSMSDQEDIEVQEASQINILPHVEK